MSSFFVKVDDGRKDEGNQGGKIKSALSI